jgi:hypothetical protein
MNKNAYNFPKHCRATAAKNQLFQRRIIMLAQKIIFNIGVGAFLMLMLNIFIHFR